MNLSNLKHIYFIGIGGIGMSALARYFRKSGAVVSGYDKVRTPLTEKLEKEGIPVIYEDDPGLLPDSIDLIIVTPAIPVNHKQLTYLSGECIPIRKRSEVLGAITKDKTTIAVAGTHGKTSVSSILAHILNHTGKKVSAFVGGIMKNYDSNVIFCCDPEILVVEADEYDRSLLSLNPTMAVITAMDADHLDVHGSRDSLVETFRKFTEKIDKKGHLIINEKIETNFIGHSVPRRYGFEKGSDYQITDYRIHKNQYEFDAKGPNDFSLKGVKFRIPGRFNLENALAAAAMAFLYGCKDGIKEALETYEGVKRRFDYRINLPGMVYIDDYAHHPEEIRACVNAVKELYPGKKITGIFQPHLFTRTRDFADEFAQSLDLLDDIILLDIYPARELPIEDVSSGLILEKMKNKSKQICSKEELTGIINDKEPEILLTIGAGDIDQMVEPIEQLLLKKYA